jgi:hypothetical protein
VEIGRRLKSLEEEEEEEEQKGKKRGSKPRFFRPRTKLHESFIVCCERGVI